MSISPEERVVLGPQPPNYPPSLSRAGARPGGVDDWSISPEERVALGPQPPNYPPPLSRAGASEPHDLDHTLCRAGAPQPRDVDDVTAWPGRHCC